MHEKNIIRDFILKAIEDGSGRAVPTDVEKSLSNEMNLSRKEARAAIRSMIMKGEIVYRWELGHPFLERSFDQPVRVSPHIVLTSHSFSRVCSSREEKETVILEKGASFGTGHHPTTRLCIEGIDHLLTSEMSPWPDLSDTTLLDVGTGSGVLVLSALRLGVRFGFGIDIDPCAVFEAKKNADLNELSNRSCFDDTPFDKVNRSYSMITANLRAPTLMSLALPFLERLERPGAMVLSGMKETETDNVAFRFKSIGMEVRWRKKIGVWEAMILQTPDVC